MGYSTQLDIYCLFRNDKIIVSYGEKAKDKINFLKHDNISNVENFTMAIERIYSKHVTHHVKFCYMHGYQSNLKSEALKRSDYQAYLSFLKKHILYAKTQTGLKNIFIV